MGPDESSMSPLIFYSLPCNHILCHGCLVKLDPKKCPHCRKLFELEDVESVGFTATEQWDQLLKVATEATRLSGIDDASVLSADEQSELPFIDDDDDER